MLTSLQQRLLEMVGRLPEAEGFALAGGAALIMRGTVDRSTNDLDPVGPPPEGHPGWLFAVEDEAVLSWAWRICPQTPVVWHGSDAAALMLQAAASAGWRVAVSADFEPGRAGTGCVAAVPLARCSAVAAVESRLPQPS